MTKCNCQDKNVKGKYVWSDGTNIKSYSVKHNGHSWGYGITDYDQNGKRKYIQKTSFATEQEAKDAAEAVLAEMFKASETVLKRVK